MWTATPGRSRGRGSRESAESAPRRRGTGPFVTTRYRTPAPPDCQPRACVAGVPTRSHRNARGPAYTISSAGLCAERSRNAGAARGRRRKDRWVLDAHARPAVSLSCVQHPRWDRRVGSEVEEVPDDTVFLAPPRRRLVPRNGSGPRRRPRRRLLRGSPGPGGRPRSGRRGRPRHPHRRPAAAGPAGRGVARRRPGDGARHPAGDRDCASTGGSTSRSIARSRRSPTSSSSSRTRARRPRNGPTRG